MQNQSKNEQNRSTFTKIEQNMILFLLKNVKDFRKEIIMKKQVVKLTEKELIKVVGGRGVSSRISKNKFTHDIYKRIFKWK